MAYVKNIWVDQDVERPKTYEVTNNQDGSITLTDSFGLVTELGTPVNADNMNHIENGISTVDTNIGNLSNLQTENKTSVVNAINSLVNVEEDKYHALKGYLDEGELLTDTEGLADVENYAHSTFDSTKFTKEGSPTVTSNGIASGFSSSDYITCTNIFNPSNSKWLLSCNFKTGIDITTQQWIFTNIDYGIRAVVLNDTLKLVIGSTRYGSDIWNVNEYSYPLTANTYYLLKIKFTGNSYELYVNDILVHTVLSNLIVHQLESDTSLRLGSSPTGNAFTGSIDLKQFSITVNGVPVFSGNKTGIDTIKPDDYTVEGTPTISADGIASGFSGSNYLTTLTFNPSTKAWTIINSFTTGASVTGSNQHFLGYSVYSVSAKIDTNGHPVVYLSSNGTSNDIGTITGTYTFLANTKYYVKIDFTGSKYILSYSLDGKTYTETGTAITSSTAVYASATLYIGKASSGFPFGGSIDLNAFKVYVNGDLIYQPCLKIPYTESKTGSKIVDNFYRDRVSSMYEQYGFAPYFTLDEVNNNFTLPCGEVYGLMQHSFETLYEGRFNIVNRNSNFNIISTTINTNGFITYNSGDEPPIKPGGFVVGTDSITIPTDGLYCITFSLLRDQNYKDKKDSVRLMVNNENKYELSGDSDYVPFTGFYYLPLFEGDLVQLYGSNLATRSEQADNVITIRKINNLNIVS